MNLQEKLTETSKSLKTNLAQLKDLKRLVALQQGKIAMLTEIIKEQKKEADAKQS